MSSAAVDASALDTRPTPGRRHVAAVRWRVVGSLVATSLALSACGGSSPPKTAAQSTAGGASSARTAAPAASTRSRSHHATHAASAATRPAASAIRVPIGTKVITTVTWTSAIKAPRSGSTVTIPASSAAPAYRGVSPIKCLRAAGLNRARTAAQPGAWEANIGSTAATDSTGLLLVDGPYKTARAASQYAKSLLGIEFAQSGGRWVASASIRSNLRLRVDTVAACMATG